jgi:predicted patatin/cPLA2 family phospholipase
MTVRTAIVVEGGAMRGIFTAGVLDRLLELGLTDFDLAIGTSAGACNLASFVAQQYGRNLRCYLNVMARREFFSLRRALRGGHYMDLDWLWDRFSEEEPLDERAIERSRTQLVSVATCALTGEPVYMTARSPRVHADLKAGCAMPFLYRGPVAVGEHYVVDGGLVDPIPAEEAYRRGARRILVVRTRPSRMVKRDGPFTKPVSALLYRTPAVSRASLQTATRYQRTVAWLQSPPADAEVLELAPPAPLKTRRTTQNKVHLRADYDTGFDLASQHAPRLRELFADYGRVHATHV